MITCIAIDDEPLALKQLVGYINKTPFLRLENSFTSAYKALEYLNDNQVDLMFVDINMPDLSGIVHYFGWLRVPGQLQSTGP